MENFQFYNQKQHYFEKKAATRTGNHIGLGLLVFIGVYLLSQVVLGMFLGAGLIPLHLLSDPVFNAIFSSVISLLSFLGGGFVILAAERKNPYNVISFEKPKSRDDYKLIIIGVGVCFAASYIMGIISQALKDTVFEPKMPDSGMPSDIAGFAAYLLMVSVIPAICEEFLFRGAILQSLRKFGDKNALIVSSVLFALMHGNLLQIPFALAAGFVMGYAAIKTGSLLIPMAMHFANNLLATVFSYIAQTVGGESVELFIFMVELVIIIAAIVLTVLYIKKNGFNIFRAQAQIASAAVLRARLIFSPATIPFLCYVVFSIIASQITG